MSEVPEIHISDIRTFRQCRRRWAWSSRLGRNLEPAIPYAPFFTGKAVHAALEYFYVQGIRPEDTLDHYLANEEEYLERVGTLWPQERETLDAEIFTVRQLLDHYFLWQENDDTNYSDKNLEYIDMEIKWEIPVTLEVDGRKMDTIFAGRFDGYCKHKPTGRYFIFETKTARSIDAFTKTLVTDEQSTFYLWASQQFYPDHPTAGVLFNIMSKSLPKWPEVTKTGRMSKNMKQASTWFFYVRALREQFPGITDTQIRDEYGAFLTDLRAKTKNYFLRYPISRSEYQMNMCVEGIKQTAREMLSNETPLYPSPSWMNCNFCLFKGPCIAMNAGGNYEELLQHEFNLRTGHESMRNMDEDD